jgi:hypothetical protein
MTLDSRHPAFKPLTIKTVANGRGDRVAYSSRRSTAELT